MIARLGGRNPCCSGPTPSTVMVSRNLAEPKGRNPCCSGPTPSTGYPILAYPIFLNPVAIPVVVDLLLRLENELKEHIENASSRNPCCSGPTPSTRGLFKRKTHDNVVAIPVVVDLLLRRGAVRAIRQNCVVAIPVVVDLLLRPKTHSFGSGAHGAGRNPCCSGPTPSTTKLKI